MNGYIFIIDIYSQLNLCFIQNDDCDVYATWFWVIVDNDLWNYFFLFCLCLLLYPRPTKLEGVYWIHLVRLSVCPSVRLSVRLSVDDMVSGA